MDTKSDSHDFHLVGLQIRNLREAKNISQEQLADKAGLATGTIGKIERGINNPKTATLLRIAHELEVPCQLLFEWTDNKKTAFSPQMQRLFHYAGQLSDIELNALCTIAKTIIDIHDP